MDVNLLGAHRVCMILAVVLALALVGTLGVTFQATRRDGRQRRPFKPDYDTRNPH